MGLARRKTFIEDKKKLKKMLKSSKKLKASKMLLEKLVKRPDAHLDLIVSQLKIIRSSKAEATNYERLASVLYISFQDHLGQFWSPRYKILKSGRHNLFTAKVKHNHSEYFVKVNLPGQNFESRFYDLLLNHYIKDNGKYFSFVTPLAMIKHDAATLLVFPHLHIKDLRYSPDNISNIVRAMAEMNAVNCSDQLSTSGELKKAKFALKPNALQDIPRRSLFASEEDEAAALMRHTTILSKWNNVINKLSNQQFSLCSMDANLRNTALIKNKLIFLDMGSAQLSPFGAELFWLLWYSGKIVDDSVIFKVYVETLKESGFEITCEEVRFNAYAATACKWLNRSSGPNGSLNKKSYLYALNCAEYCIDAS